MPPRPDIGGAGESGARATGGARRPADVWLPHWGVHGAAAFDLAVTSGLRSGHLGATVAAGGRAAADYEVRKREHLNTEQACSAGGMQFVPLVVEGCGGGWAPAAVQTWKMLGQALAACSGDGAAVETNRLYQALAVTLQRENARAVLRRQGETAVAARGMADP